MSDTQQRMRDIAAESEKDLNTYQNKTGRSRTDAAESSMMMYLPADATSG
jgi:hypothetical protein